MTFTICVFAATVVAMICSVIFKPYVKIGKVKIGLYYVITVIGAGLLLISGELPFDFAVEKITAKTAVNPLKILALFISVSLISLYLKNAGFFDYVAEKIFSKTKNGGYKLFIALYLSAAILTTFTSNDIVILTFTPPICIFCKKAKVSPVPYLFGEFVAANTWSMALIIGNPTNVYLAESTGISFFNYLKVMIFPTVVSGAVSFLLLLLIFKKSLKSNEGAYIEGDGGESVKPNRFLTALSLIHLFGCLVFLAVAEFIGAESYLVCVISAASLTLFYSLYCTVKEKSIKRIVKVFSGAPYELIPFVLSMFIIVSSLSYCGFTEKLSSLLLTANKTDAISFGFLSAVASNFLNNIPMSVLFERIVAGDSAAALFGSVMGSNIGAFITPVGALAGIMWSKILSDYGVKFPFWKFCLLGVIIALPTISAGTLALLITV